MSQESAEFDDRLRRVAPPAGMAARLRAIPDWSDRDLDAQLASVEVPSELVERLYAIVDDCRLDEHLRNVTVPPSVLVQSRRIAGRQQQAWVRRRATQWAVAASLMLLVWSGFVGAAAAFLAISLPEPALHKVVWLDAGPLRLDGRQLDNSVAFPLGEQPFPWVASNSSYDIPDALEPESPAYRFVSTGEQSPLADLSTTYAREGSALWESPFAVQWDWLTQHAPPPAERAAWELAAVAPSSTSSVLWQTDAPQPHLFMLDQSPVFAPAYDRRLEVSQPWLSLRTTSFAWAAASAAGGRFPSGESLHAADFVAAMDFDSLRVEPGAVEWEVHAITSSGGLMHQGVRPLLVQICAQAGRLSREQAPPSELQVVLDTSESMAAGRLEAARLALTRFFEHLQQRDRVSLVTFSAQAHPASRWLAARQSLEWRKALAGLEPAGVGDPGSGLQAALENLRERGTGSGEANRRIVLISDSDWQLTADQQQALARLAAEAKAEQIQIHIVHLGPSGEPRRQLTEFATSTGGQCLSAGDASEILRAVLPALYDRDPIVADELSFTVRFDPKQVAAYRLIGDHRPSIVAGDHGNTASLAAGESVAVLYEVWLRPETTGSPLTLEARWRNRQTNTGETRRSSLSISELASASDPPPSLWLASLAMATADALRRSGDAEIRERIDQVLTAARNGPSSLLDRADVARMIGLLEASRNTIPDPRRTRGERNP